jgi:hypothetical protein
MTNKYKFNYNGVITDLGSVFQSGNSGITTKYKTSNGSDLGSQFMAGNSGIVTGYKTFYNSGYVDLGSLFEKKLPFIASGATQTGVAVGNPKYYYAIYTNPVTLQAITYNGINTSLNIIAVGGGGGGGSSSDGESDGGGGGGAVYQITDSFLYYGISYDIYVGQGGAGGGPSGSQGGAGINSTVWRTEGGSGAYIINCLGGQPGNNTAAGSGGTVAYPLGISGDGGAGGDRNPGLNANFQPLVIPSYLITAAPSYISNNYSGGGGGSKGNSDQTSFSGGYGGGWGFGGERGIENATGTVGQNGVGYGGGGGAGGFTRTSTNFNGGAGAGGIIIVYAEII